MKGAVRMSIPTAKDDEKAAVLRNPLDMTNITLAHRELHHTVVILGFFAQLLRRGAT